MKSLLPCGLLYLQLLIVVSVESVKSIGIIHYYIKQRTTIFSKFLLILDSPTENFDQLAQFVIFLRGNPLIDSIAIEKILLQYLVSPDAKSRGIL